MRDADKLLRGIAAKERTGHSKGCRCVMGFIFAFITVAGIIAAFGIFSALFENAVVCELFDLAKNALCAAGRFLLNVIMFPAWAVWTIVSRL